MVNLSWRWRLGTKVSLYRTKLSISTRTRESPVIEINSVGDPGITSILFQHLIMLDIKLTNQRKDSRGPPIISSALDDATKSLF